MGIESIISKLDRIILYVDYLTMDETISHHEADMIRSRLHKWQQALREERGGLEDRNEKALETLINSGPLNELFNHIDIYIYIYINFYRSRINACESFWFVFDSYIDV